MTLSLLQVTRLILTLITVYLLCWLPHWAVQLLLMFGPPGDDVTRDT